MTNTEFTNSYIVGFQFKLSDDEETYQGSTTITTEQSIDEDNPEHFQEVAKTIFRAINESNPDNLCEKVSITSIAEDSEEIRAIKKILDNADITRESNDIII